MEITNSIYKKSPAVGPGRAFLRSEPGLQKTARAARVPTQLFTQAFVCNEHKVCFIPIDV
jgi:hypothetical protein